MCCSWTPCAIGRIPRIPPWSRRSNGWTRSNPNAPFSRICATIWGTRRPKPRCRRMCDCLMTDSSLTWSQHKLSGVRIARVIEEATGFAPSVVSIGKFDGVHAGHAHLLRQVVAEAAQHGLTPSVLTFDPHPLCVLAPDRAPKALASVEERCERMQELGIQQIFVLRFSVEIAR